MNVWTFGRNNDARRTYFNDARRTYGRMDVRTFAWTFGRSMFCSMPVLCETQYDARRTYDRVDVVCQYYFNDERRTYGRMDVRVDAWTQYVLQYASMILMMRAVRMDVWTFAWMFGRSMFCSMPVLI